MKLSRTGVTAVVVCTAVALIGGIAAGVATAGASATTTIPFGLPITGTATYYNDAGFGACGTPIDASSQLLVAVPAAYWTTANPNVDPLCSGVSVQATYHGKTITVPVTDKCPSCDPGHIDLSRPAFAQFDDPAIGVLTGVTWTFVSSGHAATGAVTGPVGTAGGPGGAVGSTVPAPAPQLPAVDRTTVAAAAGSAIGVYLTGYGWWDNSPPGSSAISNPVIHRTAGGAGTYVDPVTAAVPYHCATEDGPGCLHWPAGTRFYLPSLQRYLIVEDVCGDDGPDSCGGDDGAENNGDHLDAWVGGQVLSRSASDACENRITGTTQAILDPPDGMAVTPGDICG
jgi:hypothetical protein